MKDIISFVCEKFANLQRGDEFYTRYKDIEKELSNYDLKGKRIYCNCDNPEISNFWKYLHDNFDKLGLQHLYATFFSDKPKMYDYDGEDLRVGDIDSGKFEDNEDKIDLWKIDMIITNPPYSNKLPNKLVEMCIKHKLDFIIVAPLHFIQSKDIFEMYKNNKIFTGYTLIHTFERPDGSTEGQASAWFTNIEVKHPKKELSKEYNEKEYPKYDKYDAIEVSKYKNIPKDYDGLMGVPYNFITSMSKEQFEAVDIIRPKLNGKNIMMRLVIKYKK